MNQVLRVALGQINPIVGDLSGNSELIASYVARARDLGADVVAFPELAITGYPPEDLLLKPDFLDDNLQCLQHLAAHSQDITIVVGFVDVADDIYNAAAVLHGGEIRGVHHKMYLPNYGVFDEERYFQRGREAGVFTLGETGIGVNVCEDIWYPTGPTAQQARAGADVIINISASPYRRGIRAYRERMLATRAQDHFTYVCLVNTVGGQDDLVFDGQSVVFDPLGNTAGRAPGFEESLLLIDLDVSSIFRQRLRDPRTRRLEEQDTALPVVSLGAPAGVTAKEPLPRKVCEPLDGPAETYAALRLALRDYVRKSRFSKVVVGLSGGVDSSLVATIASDALGSENVIGVSMPSRYSSLGSRTDAAEVAANLGIKLLSVPVEGIYSASLDALGPEFEGTEFGLAEENLQSRARGNVLMALSNKFGWLVVTTGNKSESAVGYSTLYGDTAGGFALIKDVPKTHVYELCRYRNALGQVIPDTLLTKPASAELRPNQKDEDSLPPYAVLDPILEHYIEGEHSVDDIAAMGYDRDTVARVVTMVDRAEYKRRQSPPGPKLTPRAFGRDRRLPIVNGYTGQ